VTRLNYDKPEFIEVLGRENNCSVYKFTDITNSGQNVNIYYLLHNKMDNTIKDVSKENKKWQTDIAPLLKAGGCVSEPEDLKFRTFFRERKFVIKSNNNKMLLFSSFMEEIEEPDKAMYQAKLKKLLHCSFLFKH